MRENKYIMSINYTSSLDFSNISTNLQHLGTLSRSGWWWSKSLLSFDKNGHLKIIQLNIIQLLARKLFGCYQETHLKTVILGWNSFQAVHGCVCPELSKKLSSLWAKKHSEQILLPQPDIFFFGNSQLKEAEVIGIAELFSDPDNSKFCSKLLSENYREGDVILVEGIDANIKIAAEDDIQTIFLSKQADIYGWEPVGYKELKDKIFEPLISLEEKFASHFLIVKRLLNNVHFAINPQEFKFRSVMKGELKLDDIEKYNLWQTLLDAFLESFISTILKIEECHIDKSKERPFDNDKLPLRFGSSDNDLLDKFKETYEMFLQTSKTQNECAIVLQSLEDLKNHYNRILQKKKYNMPWTVEQQNFFRNTWHLRQESLCHEINYYRKLNKRVFVCAGSAHYFPNQGTAPSPVMETLNSYKFTVAIRNIPQNATYYSFAELAKKFNLVHCQGRIC